MTSTTWITLLAYSARATHEAAQVQDRLDRLREAARRDRIFTELRLAVSRALERRLADVEGADCDVSTGNGHSPHEFLVHVTDGCSGLRAMSVEPTATGAACRYAFGGRLECRGGERDLQVLWAADALLPARVTGGRTQHAFKTVDATLATADALGAALLTPLLDGWLS